MNAYGLTGCNRLLGQLTVLCAFKRKTPWCELIGIVLGFRRLPGLGHEGKVWVIARVNGALASKLTGGHCPATLESKEIGNCKKI